MTGCRAFGGRVGVGGFGHHVIEDFGIGGDLASGRHGVAREWRLCGFTFPTGRRSQVSAFTLLLRGEFSDACEKLHFDGLGLRQPFANQPVQLRAWASADS